MSNLKNIHLFLEDNESEKALDSLVEKELVESDFFYFFGCPKSPSLKRFPLENKVFLKTSSGENHFFSNPLKATDPWLSAGMLVSLLSDSRYSKVLHPLFVDFFLMLEGLDKREFPEVPWDLPVHFWIPELLSPEFIEK